MPGPTFTRGVPFVKPAEAEGPSVARRIGAFAVRGATGVGGNIVSTAGSIIPGGAVVAMPLGGLIGGVGELGAQALEEGSLDQLDRGSLARAAVAGGMTAIPGRYFLAPGKVLNSVIRGGATSAGGEATRQVLAGEDINANTIGTAGLVGGVTGGVLGRLTRGPKPPVDPGLPTPELAKKTGTAFDVKPNTPPPGGGTPKPATTSTGFSMSVPVKPKKAGAAPIKSTPQKFPEETEEEFVKRLQEVAKKEAEAWEMVAKEKAAAEAAFKAQKAERAALLETQSAKEGLEAGPQSVIESTTSIDPATGKATTASRKFVAPEEEADDVAELITPPPAGPNPLPKAPPAPVEPPPTTAPFNPPKIVPAKDAGKTVPAKSKRAQRAARTSAANVTPEGAKAIEATENLLAEERRAAKGDFGARLAGDENELINTREMGTVTKKQAREWLAQPRTSPPPVVLDTATAPSSPTAPAAPAGPIQRVLSGMSDEQLKKAAEPGAPVGPAPTPPAGAASAPTGRQPLPPELQARKDEFSKAREAAILRGATPEELKQFELAGKSLYKEIQAFYRGLKEAAAKAAPEVPPTTIPENVAPTSTSDISPEASARLAQLSQWESKQPAIPVRNIPARLAKQVEAYRAKALSVRDNPNLSEAEKAAALTKLEVTGEKLQAAVTKAETGPSGGPGLQSIGSFQGAADLIKKYPQFAGRLAGGALGAAAGLTFDPLDDPLSSATLGAAAGLSAPELLRGIQSLGVNVKQLPGVEQKLQTARGTWEVAAQIGHLLPHIQRFNLLMSPEGLLANAVVGPWGSGLMGAMTKAAAGDARGAKALEMLRSPVAVGKNMIAKKAEAEAIIRAAKGGDDLLRAEIGGPGLEQAPEGLRTIIQTPGTYMTAGDLGIRDILMKAGFTEAEAREMTLTSEPFVPLMKFIANIGRQQSPMLSLMAPFTKTPANILEQGAMNIPGVGFAINNMREARGAPEMPMNEQVGRQAIGTVVFTAAFLAGAGLPPEVAARTRRYISNAAGQYSLQATLGFASGQSYASGNGVMPNAYNVQQTFPLPTADPLMDVYNYAAGDNPNAQVPFKPAMVKDFEYWTGTATPTTRGRGPTFNRPAFQPNEF